MLQIFTAYRGISRVWLTRFEQLRNEDEPSSVHRETVVSTLREKTLPPRKTAAAAAAAAAIPCQCVRRQSPTAEKKSAFERTEFGLWFLDDTRGEDIIQNAHLQVRLLRHHDKRTAKKLEQRVGKRIHVCGSVALPLPQKLQICNWETFVQSEDHKRIIPQRMMNHAKIPYKSTIHLYRESSTRSTLYWRSWTGSTKKRT